MKRVANLKWMGSICGCLSLMIVAAPVSAQQNQTQFQPQQRQSVQPPLSSQPVPNTLELSKMIWSTMAAVDHANKSGNYSVLRDNAAPSFQRANNASRLSEIFASIRKSRIDLSTALLLAPTYSAPPTLVQANLLRVRGVFGLRPTAIAFDLQYFWVGGRWRLFGISLAPQSIATQQPAPAPSRPARRN